MATVNTFGWCLVTVLNGDRHAKILIISDRIKLGDCPPFARAMSDRGNVNATFAADQEIGGTMSKYITDETLLVGYLYGQHAIRI